MKRSKARSEAAIEFARQQRRTSNEFVHTVWQWIRNRQVHRAQFRREYPIPPYTVDFCCVELMLIIEIDGESHFTDEGRRHDQLRDPFLRGLGYHVLRIPGLEVLRDDGVAIAKIRGLVKTAVDAKAASKQVPGPSPPAPLPFVPQGRGEPDN